ncbi:MAG: TlpA disulfide reductase family protein [Gammaproteobacteria bacterium]|nr:TlpA disulfide reductase family protein [Gammaproteobacteria bacterium]
MNARQIFILVVAGGAFAVAGYFVGQWLGSQQKSAPEEAQSAPTMPETLPAFTLYNLDGEAVTTEDLKGKTLFINFWATWCKPCRKEIPLLVEMQEKYSGDGLEIVGIAIDNKEAVTKFLESLGGVNYPVLLGKKELDAIDTANEMGVDLIGLPISVTVAADGRMLDIHTGEVHREDAEKLIQDALAAGKAEAVASN